MSAEWSRIREANRIRQERELQERAEVQTQLEANATHETIRHRRACVIDEMLNREYLRAEQHRAGIEIARVWEQITAGLFAKVQKYDREVRGVSHSDWQAGMITAYHDRYIPWREEAGKKPVRNQTEADLVFLVVVDNYGMQQVADHYRMRRESVKAIVRESLHRYAEIGGWVDVCGRSRICA
jgi:hypothetical protein